MTDSVTPAELFKAYSERLDLRWICGRKSRRHPSDYRTQYSIPSLADRGFST